MSRQLLFHSKNAQAVTAVRVKMIEKYSRGRGKQRLVDEYLIGEITLKKRIPVPAEEPVALEFTLIFERVKSAIDEFGGKNFLTGGLLKMAKTKRNVASEYRIKAEAQVEGTALNSFASKILKMVERQVLNLPADW